MYAGKRSWRWVAPGASKATMARAGFASAIARSRMLVNPNAALVRIPRLFVSGGIA